MPEADGIGKVKECAAAIGAATAKRAQALWRSSMFVKGVLIVGGSVVAGVAQFAASGDTIHPWAMAGIAASILVGIGGLFVLLSEYDASEQLEAARKAVEVAREQHVEATELEYVQLQLRDQIDRGVALHTAIMGVRGVIEQSLAAGANDPVVILRKSLEIVSNSLVVSFGFASEDTWTICIYKAELEAGQVMLRCVAHDRTIMCDMDTARRWPAGVGAAGVAYAQDDEVIVPDLLAPELGSIFSLGDRARDHDYARYRSIAAVPVDVGENCAPWGVVVVTSDRPGHFDPGDTDRLTTSEPARALAGMAALAIQGAMSASQSRVSGAEVGGTAANNKKLPESGNMLPETNRGFAALTGA